MRVPRNDSGTVNDLRYHVRPDHWLVSPKWMGTDQSSNVSVSLKVCGVETVAQVLSLKVAAEAPGRSAFTNFQSALKFSLSRSAATDSLASARKHSAKAFQIQKSIPDLCPR